MYIDDCIAKNLKTNWNEVLTLNCGIDLSCPDEYDIQIITETLNINFTAYTNDIEKLTDKLAAYLPYNKEFLLSLDSKVFNEENEIIFPKKSKDQEKHIENKIKKFAARGKKNNFKDYLNLKSGGKDKYSSMKLEMLKSLVDIKSINEISNINFDEKYQAVAYRWVLRGLPVDMAIHKVKVDLEVMSNIRSH